MSRRGLYRGDRRGGNVILVVAILIVVLAVISALAIDMSMLVAERWRLQAATDHCALAVAAAMANRAGGNTWSEELQEEASAFGINFMTTNEVAGYVGDNAVVPQIQLGWAETDPVTGGLNAFEHAATDGTYFNAIRVVAGLGGIFEAGQAPSILGRAAGYVGYDLTATAIAKLPPRDIVFAVDESTSMNDDSSLNNIWLMHQVSGSVNLRDVWRAFSYSAPFVAADQPQGIHHPAYSANPTAPGPRFGTFMKRDQYLELQADTGLVVRSTHLGYGSSDAEMSAGGAYRPDEDPGLVSLPRQEMWDLATLLKLGVITPDPTIPTGYRASGLLRDAFDQPLNYVVHIRLGVARHHPADLNGDGAVNGQDQQVFNASMGPCPLPCMPGEPSDSCVADFNMDCEVDDLDHPGFTGGSYAWPGETVDDWISRVGVALGLYHWTPAGALDTTIPGTAVQSQTPWSGELSMPDPDNPEGPLLDQEAVHVYGFRWSHWISAMRATGWNYGHPIDSFQNCFGVKTLWQYLLASRWSHLATPQFATSPAQPLHACKNAAQVFVEKLAEINNDDQLALVMYASDALEWPGHHRWIDFRSVHHYGDVVDHLWSRQPGHQGGTTNTGQALDKAIDLLVDPDSWNFDQPDARDPRGLAQKVILLLTDGKANVDANGVHHPNADDPAGFLHAYDQALRARALDVTIHSISIGADAHWLNSCPPPEGSDILPQWSDPTQCGVGQSVSYVTRGRALRVAPADLNTVEDQIGAALLTIAGTMNGRPVLVE